MCFIAFQNRATLHRPMEFLLFFFNDAVFSVLLSLSLRRHLLGLDVNSQSNGRSEKRPTNDVKSSNVLAERYKRNDDRKHLSARLDNLSVCGAEAFDEEKHKGN